MYAHIFSYIPYTTWYLSVNKQFIQKENDIYTLQMYIVQHRFSCNHCYHHSQQWFYSVVKKRSKTCSYLCVSPMYYWWESGCLYSITGKKNHKACFSYKRSYKRKVNVYCRCKNWVANGSDKRINMGIFVFSKRQNIIGKKRGSGSCNMRLSIWQIRWSPDITTVISKTYLQYEWMF